MPIRPDSAEFKRLMMQVERDILNCARLRLLLIDADDAITEGRQNLRAVNAPMTRARQSRRSLAVPTDGAAAPTGATAADRQATQSVGRSRRKSSS